MTNNDGASIANDSVVSIHYTLRGEDKQILDSSEGQEPLTYLHGHGQIIPGLEKALLGKNAGEKLNVEVSPEEGYGEYDDRMKMEVPIDQFPKEAPLEVGSMFELVNDKEETLTVRVTAVNGDIVSLDANHPLAGKKLFFEVEISTIRKATPSELEHRHAHGGDGHHH